MTYPDDLEVRPLTSWPGTLTPDSERQRSQFSAFLSSTLETLNRELYYLDAEHPVLEVAIDPGQFRLDGRPRAQAKAAHPGVVLSLPATSVGPLRYATDRYLTWQDNLRAIALGLEALRKVDRYGITRRGEQYAGFKALPSGATPMQAAAPAMTVEQAARLLADLAAKPGQKLDPDVLITYPGTRAAAYRVAARQHHPDAGGDRRLWDGLEQAKRVLDEHGGRA